MRTMFAISAVAVLFAARCAGHENRPQYAVSKIPAELLKNAHTVIRDYHKTVDIVSVSEIAITEEYAITILNKDAYENSALTESYDKFMGEVDEIDGALYDKDGKEIKELKKSDVTDIGYYQVEMFNNYRAKHFEFNYSNYPFTVYYKVRKTRKETLHLPVFQPQVNRRCAVEHAKLEVLWPKSCKLRYRTFHIDTQPVVTETDGRKKLSLSVAGISAEQPVELQPEENFPMPALILALDEFEVGGVPGRMDSWQAFGKFVYDLNANRDVLTPERKKLVHKSTDSCTSNISKINVLFNYLKQSTRYIAIDIGLGGWQCLEASFIAANEYGDCKGLSNYMHAMLKEAGIPSYGVLVYGGADHARVLMPDFPYNTFNHYILCVPNGSDSVWMDCTAKTGPAGYLAAFTSNRDALLLAPGGGYIVKTPAYTANENYARRNVSLHINGSGDREGKMVLNYSGVLCDAEAHSVHAQGREAIIQHLAEKFSLSAGEIADHKISHTVNAYIPALEEDIVVNAKAKQVMTGKRLFIDAVHMPIKGDIPDNTEPRTKPFRLFNSYAVCDTQTITIDGSYVAEHLPATVAITKPFGTFNSRAVFDGGNTIRIVRYYEQKDGVYAAEYFADYVAMGKAINANQQQVVLVKKE